MAGLSEKGFSFDLVSRRKAARADQAEISASEEEAATEEQVAPANETILEDPDLMVEPFESVLQQLRGSLAAKTDEDPAVKETPDRPLTLAGLEMAAELDAAHDPAPEPEADTGAKAAQDQAPVREPIAEILRLLPEQAVKPEQAAKPAPAPSQPATEAAPETSSAPRPRSRVKTTFLGFERSDGRIEDVFAKEASTKQIANRSEFPFGWVVITKGPGRGTSIAISAGVSQIGRGDDQAIQLDFGDTSISRQNHAAIAFDDEDRKFYLGHGGKANIVRLNGKPVLSTEPLSDGDLIRIGETTMTFVAFCGEDFVWEKE
ncbi:FHA domain-containing protein [Defluviimonas sp. WL0002]|uniref:FHA domain-containing protein n=1 Tax=Albidovulum marisflavi TaxID=2984159 RepID=A0ABT2ZHJ1_9RHOB|nr:FHA domain-containing protein [Defluviimonas sp. WL0002]MCV2870599.1 FHA domain-containing protein [Defluviimonas sp. WL0002]